MFGIERLFNKPKPSSEEVLGRVDEKTQQIQSLSETGFAELTNKVGSPKFTDSERKEAFDRSRNERAPQ